MSNTSLLEDLARLAGEPMEVVAAAVTAATPIMRLSGVTPESLTNDGPGHADRFDVAWAAFGPFLRRAKEAAE